MTRELSTRQGFTSGPVPRHLQRLPADARGFPVPFIAEWTDEHPDANIRRGDTPFTALDLTEYGSPFPYVIAMDPKGSQGVGKPRLASLQPVRQRECILGRVCQVCGQKQSPEETLVFIGGRREDKLLAFREPGLHRRCAAFALFACPGINQANVIVVETRTYGVLPESMYVTYDGEQEIRTRAPIGEWLPPNAGFLVGLLAHLPDDAAVFDRDTWRADHEHLLDMSGKKKPRK